LRLLASWLERLRKPPDPGPRIPDPRFWNFPRPQTEYEMTPSNRHLMSEPFEPASDDVLLARIAMGAGDALAALFRRRQADVYRFALHMSGAVEVAEDVTQDVFLIVMRDAGRYEPGRSTAAAWLCGIARNCVRQRLERDGRWESLDEEAAGDDPPAAALPDPLGEMARSERLEMLRRAVMALPVRYREVVVLCDLEELSYAEAADALGCAIGTVRSRLHRARTMLAVRVAALDVAQARTDASQADEPRLPLQRRCMA
jgi:RNA polymerase sigma-70 factor (ECF subfamily)